MKKIFFLSIFATLSLIFGQDYTWPTETGKELTSNFGEFRDSHFHMGLDIRTQSTIDHPLFAIQDGFIYRIATNFNGYGKVLYVKTLDGKIAVYGHLNRFIENLEELVHDLQNENNSYIINKFFASEEYPVKKGDIIGYSGNSGGSTGPHLHFELRNGIDQPLNPMTNGFPITDNIPPNFLDLSIIPLAEGTRINDSPMPLNYSPIQLSRSKYILKDTISVAGIIGITTQVTDKISDASFSYQIEKLELLVDSISAFNVQYNLLDFGEGEDISTVYGQPISHPKRNDFQKLYRLESYPKLTIHKDDKTGIINLSEGLQILEILAWDAAQNKSVLTFYINSDKSIQNTEYDQILNLIDYIPFENDSNIFKPEIVQIEKGAIFQINTDINNSIKIVAFIEKQDKLLTFPLLKNGVDKYVSEMINPNLFKDCKACGFLIYSDTIQKYQFDFIPIVILPDSVNNIISNDSLCTVKTNQAFYDTTLMWVSKQTKPIELNFSNRIIDIYELHPFGIPYKNDIVVSFTLAEDLDLNHCAIYTFNYKKSKWDFEKTGIDTIKNIISSKLGESNICTILEDKTSPAFVFLYPEDNELYSIDTLKGLLIKLSDDLSGINFSEEYLQVFLDGKRIWVAYQPIDKEISYNLRKPLALGEHNLLINIQDRSGNSASKSIKFFVE